VIIKFCDGPGDETVLQSGGAGCSGPLHSGPEILSTTPPLGSSLPLFKILISVSYMKRSVGGTH
jgi:hypothetical protein